MTALPSMQHEQEQSEVQQNSMEHSVATVTREFNIGSGKERDAIA